jgi:hypothetical protein
MQSLPVIKLAPPLGRASSASGSGFRGIVGTVQTCQFGSSSNARLMSLAMIASLGTHFEETPVVKEGVVEVGGSFVLLCNLYRLRDEQFLITFMQKIDHQYNKIEQRLAHCQIVGKPHTCSFWPGVILSFPFASCSFRA